MLNILPDNHRRSLSVTCRFVEKALYEIEELLANAPLPMLANHLELTYSREEKEKLLTGIHRLREQNRDMFVALDLESETVTDRQIIEAKLNHLWVVLEGSKAKHLKGYGPLPTDSARIVNHYVEALSRTVGELLWR